MIKKLVNFILRILMKKR